MGERLTRRDILVLSGCGSATAVTGCLGGIRGASEREDPTFTCEYTPDGEKFGVVTITHSGGRMIQSHRLYVRGNGFATEPTLAYDRGQQGRWDRGGEATGERGGNPAVRSGDSLKVGVTEDYSLVVVFEHLEGDASETLTNCRS